MLLRLQAIIFICSVVIWQSASVEQSSPRTGIEVAKFYGGLSPRSSSRDQIDKQNGDFRPLQFRFNYSSHINGWWCVKMYEGRGSWEDNYLCTNYDIGLSWSWTLQDVCMLSLKCVFTVEPSDAWWYDNALCLPSNSKIELVWSFCGPRENLSCIQLYDPSSPSYFHDNYLCWRQTK
ncbi:unnamed protein product [Rotaria magnacalcarata]|uniref:Uncharacterized protein n=1 Tax=Rotaria magnacalcarata TaxID=392030 RepID=A0A814UWP2_9BILA|nr:unnamed protein product [Rotaria magnacalcarata]CAF1622427.1 unnamed protein product [Rotaria magnacalcarata]CAF2018354.1 unnamed protein product [Rotaria magnacalcarata]CAF2052558.1 unnamed protein product [Rotaria magnacalcarata]CAF2268036.1 unnamed protein product [Rotaria magnacalcarata]